MIQHRWIRKTPRREQCFYCKENRRAHHPRREDVEKGAPEIFYIYWARGSRKLTPYCPPCMPNIREVCRQKRSDRGPNWPQIKEKR